MRHDPDYWYLDDVSVFQGGTQMITNGGFETGSLSPWVACVSNGTTLCPSGSPVAVGTLSPHSGTYAVTDGCNGYTDCIRQSFSAVAGQTYVVSFWMKSGTIGSGIIANVTLF